MSILRYVVRFSAPALSLLRLPIRIELEVTRRRRGEKLGDCAYPSTDPHVVASQSRK